MKTIGITILGLVAFATGGCSLYFLLLSGPDIFPFALPGLLVAGICILAIRSLTR